MSSKINWLIQNTVPGSLVLQPWLTANDIGYSLTQRYVASGWLKKISSGVYYRPDADESLGPNWVDAIQAASGQLALPVHLAGLSSLIHHGLSHYLQLNTTQVWVGIKDKQQLPKWFKEFNGQSWLYSANHKLEELLPKDVTTLTIDGKQLPASSPELAAYEVVDQIEKQISFEHVAELFQGLVNLSPRKVQSLLSRSHAVQTNRVFLFLGHYYNHQWVKRLDEAQIRLGSGKRQIVAHGSYDGSYQITVPTSISTNNKATHAG